MSQAYNSLTSPIPDYLLNGGARPSVDPTREYLASGGSSFPLVGQLLLSRGCDDLTRDLGPRIYEIMLHDPTVASGFWTLVTGILAGEFQILPAVRPEQGETVDPQSDRGGEIALSETVAGYCQRQIDRLNRPIKQVAAEFLMGLAYGVKLAEMTLEPGDGEDADALVLRSLRFKRNAAWAFVVDPFGDVVAVRGLVVGASIRDLPPNKFLIFSWLPQDNDPRGRSILRAAYNGWNLKINTWPKYFRYLDKFAVPTIVGTAAQDAPDELELSDKGLPTGNTLTPTEAMAQMLARLETGSYAAIRAGSEIHFEQAVGNGEAFGQAFTLYRHEILEGILLSARAVMESENSSKADAMAAQDVVGQLLHLGRESIENLFEDQLFHRLVELRWGKEVADRHTPDVTLGRVESKDVEKTLAAYVAAGYQIDAPTHAPVIDTLIGLPARSTEAVQEEGDERHANEIPNDGGGVL